MAKVTVTDYETVEVTEDRYRCDHCKAVVGEDEINSVAYVEGVESSKIYFNESRSECKHLCEDCIGLREAHRIREKKEYYRHWWTATREKVGLLLFIIPAFLMGASITGFAYAADTNNHILIDIFASSAAAVLFACLGGIVVLTIAIVLKMFK